MRSWCQREPKHSLLSYFFAQFILYRCVRVENHCWKKNFSPRCWYLTEIIPKYCFQEWEYFSSFSSWQTASIQLFLTDAKCVVMKKVGGVCQGLMGYACTSWQSHCLFWLDLEETGLNKLRSYGSSSVSLSPPWVERHKSISRQENKRLCVSFISKTEVLVVLFQYYLWALKFL